jgi:Extensin-like protein C-terminus
MTRRVALYLVGSLVLVSMAGCGRGFFSMAEREPWRAEAEAACMKSGEVRESPNVVRISPISGPGACGAEFPLKVAALAETSTYGFADELRPPGAIPQASNQPRWPINSYPQQNYPQQGYPQRGYGQPSASQAYPAEGAQPTYPQRNYGSQSSYSTAAPSGAIERAPIGAPQSYPAPQYGGYDSRPRAAPVGAPLSLGAPGIASPENDQTVDDPNEGVVDDSMQSGAPNYSRAPYATPLRQPLPRLGPSRDQVGSIGPVAVKPAATLACPIVSQLDRWITDSVQPAAQKWFGAPVVEIKQISAYSCRGMNGNSNAHISEHAFGNALDIAAFTLADGRRITVKDGWHGMAEEQGFLRDVQGAACQQFTTVLAPGSNAYHYDHIHVDLMRRASRRIICEPAAVSGDQIAARAGGRGRYAAQDRGYTGSIPFGGNHHGAPKSKRDDEDDEDD